MSIKSTKLTKELNESVTNLLGPNTKISLKCLVKMEIKADKTDNKVLAFSQCRMFILSAKIPTKIEQTFHYLDINSIESKKRNQLCLGLSGDSNKSLTFYSVDPNNGEEINLIIIQLGTAIKTIFPQISLEIIFKKIEVEPSSRLKPMIEYNESIEIRSRENTIENPCGHFSSQYLCMCDYFGCQFKEEVCWDVDSIYFTHNITELSLIDFEHLDIKDLVPIIAALSYNGWFTKFRASNVKIFNISNHGANDLAHEIIHLVKTSYVLEEIYLENTGIKADFINKLFMGLITNSHSSLHTIDLSNNFIEDKGLKSLCGFIAKSCISENSLLTNSTNKLNKGFVSLNLAHTNITAKGVCEIAESLSLNKTIASTLTNLNLSGNILKDDVNKLYNFLAQPNCLVNLDLSSTECCLDTIFGALLRGCTQNLAHLNLSRNQFTSKKNKDVNVPPSFKAFFSSTVGLKTINLSFNKLPSEALKAMLLGFACNELATDVRVDLSSNDLKSNGATVLEFSIADIRCISGLDLSDNNFDSDIANVINSIGKNKSIKYLSIGRNFSNIKLKHLPGVLNSIVQLVQDEESTLESLSISDSRLKNETCLIINALSSNHSLLNIDVSGNLFGLLGAKTLAKALQVNSKLESIYLDRNIIPTIGFIDIAYSLERNFSLKHLPIPVQDLQLAMMKERASERTETAINKIQELLKRNNSPNTIFKGSRIHTHHLPIDTGAYQLIDKLIIHIKDAVNNSVVNNNESDGVGKDEIQKAEAILKDASNAKQLLTKLNQQFIFPNAKLENMRRFSNSLVCKPIESQLLEFANELKTSTECFINNTVTGMMQYVQETCPSIFTYNDKLDNDFQRLLNNLTTMPNFPSLSFFQNCLLDSALIHLTNKIEDILQLTAVQICDRVLSEMSECLSAANRTLTGQEHRSLPSDQRSSTPDVLRNRLWNDESCSRDSTKDWIILSGNQINEYKSDNSATPKQGNQKRQSLYTRKLRPQSVVEGLNADAPDLLPKSDNLFSSNETSLMGKSNETLEHLGKYRPKKPKTRAPTRTAKDKKLHEKESSTEKLDEGLDHFFHKSTNESLQKPSVLPRNLLKKKSITDSKTSIEESTKNIATQLSPLSSRLDEVTRSTSSPNLGNKKQQRTNSPGADEISTILEKVERISSPVPPEHADLLAEMKAKQESRSHTTTPICRPNSTHNTVSEPSCSTTETSSASSFHGVKLRASAFGDVIKSPSHKLFGNNPTEETSKKTPPQKQRPKSVVGMLGAKFELSNYKSENIDIDSAKSSNESVKSDSNKSDNNKSDNNESDNKSNVRKTIGVFGRNRNSSYSLPK